ncbi:acyl-CoA desaturase [Leptospira gomenensis]|uniref:Acyl-CoA desaturase n=1 Tax=Leptospira gomenensis TaxID=2484974 RepID=A0A5F1YGF0_9LEPT|nr:acyl-CoA desaturase [Leptospira gomenensis]TGK31488.1 acyl-CoA desaturase [Leptospira gomenensis]TGK32478.1 acyl-CoA desaturase [Leptospira gomenensis]TGK46193.1 acyl-CoA desaturase [Leptospira gomenensis]TGK54718.1 acyl-CoA desaturase [Leptospira gomenensis]
MQKETTINWVTTIFLILTPIVGIAGTIWLASDRGIPYQTWLLFLFMMFSTGVGITAGYHRLFSHRAYKASFPVRIFFLLFGGAAFQSSVLEWSSDHRIHHRYVDKEEDPYAITKGFWFAHILWLFKKREYTLQNIPDLKEDKWIVLQHEYYLPISIFMCFFFPGLIAWTWGDFAGGVLVAGFLRLSINHHFTFFINSLCHFKGSQPFSDKHTAKDNWFLALFTYGEGYHNFHHEFQADYRNGIRFFDYDPSKWLIKAFELLGLAWDLKRIPDEQIFRKRVQMDEKRIRQKWENRSVSLPEEWESGLETRKRSLLELQSEWTAQKESRDKTKNKELESKFRSELKSWKRLISGDGTSMVS